ncbi:growth/differentiation factor 10 [Chanos chanos]|uniref:Growth/differentiation factor 10 n=1 Tax=Chanos chanos TaxID=29144 RepID=A0A6J2V7I2_CHACN|nr:growth/differentiation factor 10-like [Chanos chanos]
MGRGKGGAGEEEQRYGADENLQLFPLPRRGLGSQDPLSRLHLFRTLRGSKPLFGGMRPFDIRDRFLHQLASALWETLTDNGKKGGTGGQDGMGSESKRSETNFQHEEFHTSSVGDSLENVKFRFLMHLLLFLANTEFGGATSDPVPSRSSTHESDELDFPDVKLAGTVEDMLSQHMFKLYDKYNREASSQKNGNTVRSFKVTPETVEQKVLYQLNLTSLQESEVILSTTFHFYFDKRPRQRLWFCKRFKNPSCRVQTLHQLPSLRLLFRSPSGGASQGSQLGNVTLFPVRRGTWQTKSVTHIIKEARSKNQLLINVEFDYGEKYQRYQDKLSPSSLPYLLVYADDLAISEPNSVAMSLQRYDPFPTDEESARSLNSSPDARFRRDLHVSDPLLSNELPEVEYDSFKQHDTWDAAYLALKPKLSKKERRRKGQEQGEGLRNSQVLSFDEKTMKKARRRQWKEPRNCSKRYLKVDFADIGWSEWILSPKSFDAYYCAGTCEFPIPKVVRPSNHATIQSIVKTVGIIPGIPEPCCVPDKMNPLTVLFLDEAKNIVLKTYPNMSVDTCACR